MPHDKNGTLLQEGDEVLVRATVRSLISTGDDYCNVTLDTVEPMYPGTEKTGISLNAKQVEKVTAAAVEEQPAPSVADA